jgi:Ca2+-binding EF-hand superfamily protein
MRHFLTACALLAGIGLLANAPAGRAAEDDKDTRKIVYLGDDGPVLIALKLYIDGKPLRAAHRALMDKLFDYLDRDHDGVLSRSEAAAAPTAAVLSSPLGPILRRVAPGQARFLPGRAGQVTRAELAAYYRQNGLAPLQIPQAQPQLAQLRLAQAGQDASAEQLTDRLFKLLDTDNDGKLSRKELEAAPEVLGKLDVDEDEMITAAELMGEAGGSDPYAPVLVAVRGQANPSSGLLHVVADGGKDEALARALMQRYAKSGKTALPASPHVTLTVHLGNRSDEPLMAIRDAESLPAGIKAKVTEQGVSLQMGKSRLDLTLAQQTGVARQINVRAQYKRLFQMADANNDGFVDRMEGRMSPLFREVFDLMDRDGDGKVSEKEMLVYLDEMEKLQQLVARSCVSLGVSNEGQGLFELLDTNRDGKLSVRELRNAHKLLDRLPSGRDNLTRSDVPRHYRIGMALGPNAGQDPLGRVAIPIARQGMRVGARPAPMRGPVWFLKMDRNRDGDVSRKEFLGTDEQFKAIDTDGDGLISLAEAQAYDKRKQPDEQPERRRRERGNERERR